VAEKQTIPSWIKLILTMFAFVGATWIGGWSASKIYMANSNIVVFHEERIVKVEAEVNIVDKRLDVIEKILIVGQKDTESILAGQAEMKTNILDQHKLYIEQIKVNAEFRAWIKSRSK